MTTLVDVIPGQSPARARVITWEKAWWVPLAVILAAQAIFSARFASAYASGDEGRYIYAGHQLIYEFWHGGGSPYYETYFSGSPVIYPVLAAVADHLGGLTAVRLMSMLFMMTATGLLFAVSRKLFGYWPGILAAGLFAGFGLTQDLGFLATYDAMSLMLTAVAAYCAVRAAAGESQTMWLLLVPLALLVANATKYVTVAFVPAVIALAALQAGTWKCSFQRMIALSMATGLLLALAAVLAGGAYIQGVTYSTLARNSSFQAFLGGAKLQPAADILGESWRWTGLAILLSTTAVIFAAARRTDGRRILLLVILMATGLLVTVEALKLHSDQSMRKHDDFGVWFACLAAGSVARWYRSRITQWVTGICVAGAVIVSGMHYTSIAPSTFEAGGSRTTLQVASALSPYLKLKGARVLLGGLGDDQILYLDHAQVPWFNNSDDLYIKYPIPGRGGDSHGQARGPVCFSLRSNCMYLEGVAGYRAAIRAHWFSLISMWSDHGSAQDAEIAQAVEHTPGYVLLTRVGGAPTWIYAPAYKRGLR